METVPRSRWWSLELNSGSKVRGAEGERVCQMEEPPLLSEEVGPRGSPVWRVKLDWTVWMGE